MLQNVKHDSSADRVASTGINHWTANHGRARYPGPARGTTSPVGVAWRSTDLSCSSGSVRYESWLTQYPPQGTASAAHPGPLRRRLPPNQSRAIANGRIETAARLGRRVGEASRLVRWRPLASPLPNVLLTICFGGGRRSAAGWDQRAEFPIMLATNTFRDYCRSESRPVPCVHA
jgi:hypothetical protein